MVTKTEVKIEKIEREYTIPLREGLRVVPRYKKTPRAIRLVKRFLVRHMQIRDRDSRKIKMDKYLNEYLWKRGIKNPLHKIKVKAIKEGDVVIVKLAESELTNRLKFKIAREEKRDKKGEEKKPVKKEEKVEEKQETKEDEGSLKKTSEKEDKEKKEEEKEKKDSTVEAMKQIEKNVHKQAKHTTQGKNKEPRRQIRKPLDR